MSDGDPIADAASGTSTKVAVEARRRQLVPANVAGGGEAGGVAMKSHALNVRPLTSMVPAMEPPSVHGTVPTLAGKL